MKTNYITPHVEVIEVELEGILCESTGSAVKTQANTSLQNFGDDGEAW